MRRQVEALHIARRLQKFLVLLLHCGACTQIPKLTSFGKQPLANDTIGKPDSDCLISTQQ